ncbi:MAG TPA: class II aldolase/adducin family protein [bacterium]|nr:class II aldolase/adducin family protein [bacterium]HQO34701.1 class II aldolase/adducin family protein [bacterium]
MRNGLPEGEGEESDGVYRETNMNAFQAKQDILEAGRRIWIRGFVAANDGNISARVSDDEILCTPTGVSKGFMDPAMIATVDGEGRQIRGEWKVSSEAKMHLAVYRKRPDVHAVVHAHPPTATGFAVAGISLDQCVLPEVLVTLGGIPLAPYGLPGSEELPTAMETYIEKANVILMANHGVLSMGKNVMEAYYRLETVEHFAKILLAAVQLGNVNILSPERVNELKDLRERFNLTGVLYACNRQTNVGPAATGPAPEFGKESR